MSELETLFVRIETDLSAFKSGMAEARRETQGFATEARSTFSGVGDALDLRRFRDELAASETAAKQSAERMKRAFGDVGRAQEKAAQKAIQNLFKGSGESNIPSPADEGAKSGRTSGSSKGGSSTIFSLNDALQGAGFAGLLITAFAIPITGTAIAFIVGSALLSGALTPQLEGMSGGDSRDGTALNDLIKDLDKKIAILGSQKRFIDQFTSDIAKRKQSEAQAEIDATVALRDALLEQQRQTLEGTSQFQNLIGAMAELCTCLRELSTRVDELAPLPSGGAGARPGGIGFDGTGARLIPASLAGGSPFGGAGFARFNRELEAAGGHAGDAALRIAELTERAGGAQAEFGSLAKVLRANNILFTDQVGVVRLLDALLPELGESMTGVFTEAGAAGRDLDRVTEALGGTLIEAFKGAASEGKSFREVLLKIIQDVLVLSQTSLGGGSSGGGGGSFLGGLFDSLLGGLFGGGASAAAAPTAGPAFASPTLTAAKGGVFARGDTMTAALARGGALHNSVVSRPTLFAMAKGYVGGAMRFGFVGVGKVMAA